MRFGRQSGYVSDREAPMTPYDFRSKWPKDRRHGRKLRSNRLTISRRTKRKHRRQG